MLLARSRRMLPSRRYDSVLSTRKSCQATSRPSSESHVPSRRFSDDLKGPNFGQF
jgi:hypothetical protein